MTYEHDGHRFAVIEGELYVRLETLPTGEETAEERHEEPIAKRQRRRKTGGWKAVTAQIKERKERKARLVLGPEAEAVVIDEIRKGLGLTDTCKKYGIGVSTYYRLKNEAMSKPVHEEATDNN